MQPRAVQAGATKRAPGTTSRWVSANAKGLAKVQAKLQGHQKRKQWQNRHSRQPCAKHGARYYHMPKGGHVPHTSCSRAHPTDTGCKARGTLGWPHPGRTAKVRGPRIGYGALDRQVYASVKETQIHAPICNTCTLKQTGKGQGHLGTAYGRQVSLGPLALEALTFLKDLSREAGGTNASKGEMKVHRTGKSIEWCMFLEASRPYSARATVTSC